MKIGTVEKVEFTCGGLGNQFTTIDGRTYFTWWDARRHKVWKGVRVKYSVQEGVEVCSHPKMVGDVAVIHEVLAPEENS